MEKMLFTNNSRKMLGIPLRRKKDKRKRVYTRNRAEEDLETLVDYWDGKWDALCRTRNGNRSGSGADGPCRPQHDAEILCSKGWT